MTKRFDILDTRNDSSVIGVVTGDNCYVTIYPVPLDGNKHPLKLDIGESSLCRYALSGGSGVYRVVRLDDESIP